MAEITQVISTFPAAPDSSSDTPQDFNTKANAFVAAQVSFVPEINTFKNQANTLAAAVNSDATIATTKAGEAADSALSARASANYQGVWTSKGYTVGQSVKGSNGAYYQCDVTHTSAQNPTTTTGYWSVNIPYGAVGNINSPLLDMPLKNSLAMKAGVGSVTFTRSQANPQSVTSINRDGIIVYHNADEPRFEKYGILIEGASTNSSTNSDTFGVSVYPKSGINASIVSSAELSPDKIKTCGRIKEDATLGVTHYVSTVPYTTVSGAKHTVSMFVKEDGTSAKRYPTLVCNRGDNTYANVIFDLVNNTAKTNGIEDSYMIRELKNGWFRISVTFVATASATVSAQIRAVPQSLFDTNSATVNYDGDGTSGVFVFGNQFEQLPFASSYIPTGASAVTRNADICKIDYNGNAPYGGDDMSILMNVKALGVTTNNRLIELDDTRRLYLSSMTSVISSLNTAGTTAINPPTTYKDVTRVGVTYKGGLESGYANGLYTASTQGTPKNGVNTSIYLGANNNGISNFYGNINTLVISDNAYTATEMALA